MTGDGDLPDIVLTCSRCGAGFMFEHHTRRFFARMKFADPRDCPACVARLGRVDPFAGVDAERRRRQQGVRAAAEGRR